MIGAKTDYHKTNGPYWFNNEEPNDWGWMLHGKWHRYYGPATGYQYNRWWIHGKGIK